MSVNDQLQQAYQLIRAGNRQDAVQVLMPVLRTNPANADAWWLLANAVTDPSQKRRALEEVLKLRPNDDRAQRMLSQMSDPLAGAAPAGYSAPPPTQPTAPVPPPSPISEPFAGSADPFASSTDPFGAPARPAPPSYSPQPSYSQQPNYGTPAPNWSAAPGNVPPAPIYAGPPKKGPSCCLIFGILAVLLFCIAPVLCVGAGLAGISPVFNEVARTMGAPDFQSLANVFSGQATPAPGSALDDLFSSMGISNFNQLQGTMEGAINQLATVGGTPGMFATIAASFNYPVVGQALSSAPVNRGSIEVGQTSSGSVQPGSVGDAYLFQANAGQTYVIDAVGGDGVDTLLSILDGNNIVVEFNDDGGNVTDARLQFEAATAGKYMIVVGTYGNTGGSYTLTLGQ